MIYWSISELKDTLDSVSVVITLGTVLYLWFTQVIHEKPICCLFFCFGVHICHYSSSHCKIALIRIHTGLISVLDVEIGYIDVFAEIFNLYGTIKIVIDRDFRLFRIFIGVWSNAQSSLLSCRIIFSTAGFAFSIPDLILN